MNGRCVPRPSFPARVPRRSDHGSAAVELVLLTPIFVVLLLFVVFLGRSGQAAAKVRHAADQAARAASMVHRHRAESVARSTALGELTADGLRCSSLSVTSSASTSAGLESIEVSISCTVQASDLAPLAPGVRTITAASAEVIDVVRAVDE